MRTRWSLVLAFWLAVALPLTGCAGGGGAEPDPTMPPPGEAIVIPITVTNNWSPRTSVTVRLISSGVTRILGSVGGGSERTFEIESPSLTGQHRLSARGTGLDQEQLSQPFALFGNSTVQWTMVGNALLVGQQTEEPAQPKSP